MVTNGLLACLGKEMLILLSELSILQSDGAILMSRCIEFLLRNSQGMS